MSKLRTQFRGIISGVMKYGAREGESSSDEEEEEEEEEAAERVEPLKGPCFQFRDGGKCRYMYTCTCTWTHPSLMKSFDHNPNLEATLNSTITLTLKPP